MKQTPGPWEYEKNETSAGPSFEVYHQEDCQEDFEMVSEFVYSEADARLIAAAPDLLEALKEAVAKFREYAEIHRNKVPAFNQTLTQTEKEALAKHDRNKAMADKLQAAIDKAEKGDEG